MLRQEENMRTLQEQSVRPESADEWLRMSEAELEHCMQQTAVKRSLLSKQLPFATKEQLLREINDIQSTLAKSRKKTGAGEKRTGCVCERSIGTDRSERERASPTKAGTAIGADGQARV